MEYDSNKGKINSIKRKSEFTKANKIKNELFSFAQNEIKEKIKIANEPFSFSSQKIIEKSEPNLVLKHNNIVEKKLSNDSSCDSSSEENSSDLSCDEEDI